MPFRMEELCAVRPEVPIKDPRSPDPEGGERFFEIHIMGRLAVPDRNHAGLAQIDD